MFCSSEIAHKQMSSEQSKSAVRGSNCSLVLMNDLEQVTSFLWMSVYFSAKQVRKG